MSRNTSSVESSPTMIWAIIGISGAAVVVLVGPELRTPPAPASATGGPGNSELVSSDTGSCPIIDIGAFDWSGSATSAGETGVVGTSELTGAVVVSGRTYVEPGA